MKEWLCALAAIVILATGCSEELPTKDLVRPVRAVRVADSVGFTSRTFPGTARATEEINLAFEVQGRMIERPVNLGDKVEKDQPLARLDPRDYVNALDAALAREKSSKAQFERMARY